jgi:hypothetical protein
MAYDTFQTKTEHYWPQTESQFFVTNTTDQQKGNLFCASPVAIWTLGSKRAILGNRCQKTAH